MLAGSDQNDQDRIRHHCHHHNHHHRRRHHHHQNCHCLILLPPIENVVVQNCKW